MTGALRYKNFYRNIRVEGFLDQTVSGPITIKIFGVVNPNRNELKPQTGDFGIALLDENDEYHTVEANFKVPGVEVSLAPGGISFVSLSALTDKCRYSSNYTFVFSPF